MAWVGPALSAVGSVAGGLIGSFGQSGANRTNLRIWREQRDWQERMSNTEIQRRTEDMRLAGINPMLSVMGMGSASSPNVAPARVENEKEALGEGVSRGVQSAMQAYQLKLVDAQVSKEEANARLANANAAMVEADIPWSAGNAQQRAEKLRSEALKMTHEAGTAHVQQLLKNQEYHELMPLILRYKRIVNELEELQIPERKALAEFYETVPYAKWIEAVERVLPGAGFVGSFMRMRKPPPSAPKKRTPYVR